MYITNINNSDTQKLKLVLLKKEQEGNNSKTKSVSEYYTYKNSKSKSGGYACVSRCTNKVKNSNVKHVRAPITTNSSNTA